MQRRDYEVIEKVIKGLAGKTDQNMQPVRDLVFERFLEALKRENGSFNETKFRKAIYGG